MTSDYRLTPINESFCPRCNNTVALLADDRLRPVSPAFFICWTCRSAAQAGVGPVPSGDPEDYAVRIPEVKK